MSQFSSDKPQVFIPPAFEDFRGYLSVPYDRDVPFQVCQINQGYSREAFTLRGLHFQMGEYAQASSAAFAGEFPSVRRNRGGSKTIYGSHGDDSHPFPDPR